MAENKHSAASVYTEESSPAEISRRVSEHLAPEILDFLRSKANGDIANINALTGYSNKLVRIIFDSGRSMIVKQSQYDWAAPRFRSARRASSLLRQQTDIIAPEHIAVPDEITEVPTLAYWYLSAPTLKELWPELSQYQKKEATVSLGGLLKKMHSINVSGYGALTSDESFSSAVNYVYSDLCERLEPTIGAKWPDILPVVYELIERIEDNQEKAEDPVLIHNDFHIGNVLCTRDTNNVNCIGLLDLEEAGGGCWELDLARAVTLHHPLFAGGNLKGNCLDNFGQLIVNGYDKKPDTELLRLFRVYHLLNLGLYSAMNQKHEHATDIGNKARQLLNGAAGFVDNQPNS